MCFTRIFIYRIMQECNKVRCCASESNEKKVEGIIFDVEDC